MIAGDKSLIWRFVGYGFANPDCNNTQEAWLSQVRSYIGLAWDSKWLKNFNKKYSRDTLSYTLSGGNNFEYSNTLCRKPDFEAVGYAGPMLRCL